MMDERRLLRYRKFVDRMRHFHFLGAALHSRAIPASVSYFLAFLGASSCFVMLCVTLNLARVNIKNLNVITRAMSFSCSLIATTLKTILFAINRNKLIELDESLIELFDEELAYNSRTKSVVLSLLHTFDVPTFLYTFFVGATISAYIFPAFISIIIQHARQAETIKYSLPFPGEFPWTIEGGSFSYQMHFLFETSVGWILYVNCSIDALFGFYIFHIASLLKAMTFKLKNPVPNDDPEELLRDCVQKHQKLLHCRDLLQNIFGPLILFLVFANAVVMCALIFQGSQIQNMSFRTGALFGFYMFLKLTQTFMLSWYGGVMVTESENFREGLYYCDWFGENGKALRARLIITMLQKPMIIKASGFFDVSVDIFHKVLSTTMSYYFLLQTLDEK